MDTKIFKELMKKRNVVSVGKGIKKVGGVSTGRPCIVIGVTKKVPLADLTVQDIIPQTVGNHAQETDVVEMGEIKLLGVESMPAGHSEGLRQQCLEHAGWWSKLVDRCLLFWR